MDQTHELAPRTFVLTRPHLSQKSPYTPSISASGVDYIPYGRCFALGI